MKKQLQHTTLVVFILLLFLGGTLYILDSSYFKTTNYLTGATIASDNENNPCTEHEKQSDESKERAEEDCPETS